MILEQEPKKSKVETQTEPLNIVSDVDKEAILFINDLAQRAFQSSKNPDELDGFNSDEDLFQKALTDMM